MPLVAWLPDLPLTANPREGLRVCFLSIDPASATPAERKRGRRSDTAVQRWGVYGATPDQAVLVALVALREDLTAEPFPALLRRLRACALEVDAYLVENTAAGPALAASLEADLRALPVGAPVPTVHLRSPGPLPKALRARLALPYLWAGRVLTRVPLGYSAERAADRPADSIDGVVQAVLFAEERGWISV
jgi:hypothetical protein